MKLFYMKLLGVLAFIFSFELGYGQYYYNDIIGNQQKLQQFVLAKDAVVKSISVLYWNGDGSVNADTIIQQKYNSDYSQSITNFIGDTLHSSIMTSFFKNDKIDSSMEKSMNVETKIKYEYNEQGKLKTIQSVSKDKSDTTLNYSVTEFHSWQYNNAGKPLQMLRVKNNTDTLTVKFILDETGKVVEEHWLRKNANIETYYYYYDKENRLTDIVHYNKKYKRLLPDFTFEYNARGFISQMLQVPNSNNTNYLVWNYTYNDKNLKKEEVCTNKQKQLVGKMIYVY